MRRVLLASILAAAVATAGGANAQTFTVTATPAALPSYEVPNAPGSIVIPTSMSTPPAVPERRTYAQLLQLWQRAGAAYGVPWQVLGAINRIESNFGGNMGPSSAGALGWMQFMPETWMRWGMDANGDGIASPWNPEDAVYAAARYLAAAGAHDDLSRAIFAYNHAQWYVDDVLEQARTFGDGTSFGSLSAFPPFLAAPPTAPALVFGVDDIEERLAAARKQVTRANRSLVKAEEAVERLEWARLDAEQRAGDPKLSDADFAAVEAEVTRLVLDEDDAERVVDERQAGLDEAVAAVELLEQEATVQESAVTFTRPAGAPAPAGAGASFGGASGIYGDYVFPVGGGPSVVSATRDHHDYPAVDIAAPQGSPVYAHTTGVILDSYTTDSGRCGIGFRIQTTNGQIYVYCHLSYLAPDVAPGAALPAGAPVGLVGSTGSSTGPHLHVQTSPATVYPQNEPWFQAFAGRSFRWEGEAVRLEPRVFEVIGNS